MVASGVSEVETPGLNSPLASEERGGDHLAVRKKHRPRELPPFACSPGRAWRRREKEAAGRPLSESKRLGEWRGVNV